MCKAYKAKGRGDPRYHQERYGSLAQDNDLAQADRVACYLLALLWSSGEGAAGGRPHESAYRVATDTTAAAQTAGSVDLKSLDKTQRRDLSSRRNTWATVAVPEPPAGKPHWKSIIHSAESAEQYAWELEAWQAKNTEYERKLFNLRQLDLQLDCAAAAKVGGTWYFATNNLEIPQRAASQIMLELGEPSGRFHVADFDTANLHAEMKIMKVLQSAGLLAGRTPVGIGVSKPCCPKCKEVLDRWGVGYTSYHAQEPLEDRWTDPELGSPG